MVVNGHEIEHPEEACDLLDNIFSFRYLGSSQVPFCPYYNALTTTVCTLLLFSFSWIIPINRIITAKITVFIWLFHASWYCFAKGVFSVPTYIGSHWLGCNSHSIRVFPLFFKFRWCKMIYQNCLNCRSFHFISLEVIKSLPYVLILFLIWIAYSYPFFISLCCLFFFYISMRCYLFRQNDTKNVCSLLNVDVSIVLKSCHLGIIRLLSP